MILGQPIHTNDDVKTTELDRHKIDFESSWSFVSAVPSRMTYLVAIITLDNARSYVMQNTSSTQWEVSNIPTVLCWSGSITSNSFFPSVLLWLAIIIAIVGVGVTVVVVVEKSGTIVGYKVVNSWNLLTYVLRSFPFTASSIPMGWAKEFHQDRASSVKVPVANFTL
ncbi:hypothetical protein Tco_0500519 [Tanacetum coccineum]